MPCSFCRKRGHNIRTCLAYKLNCAKNTQTQNANSREAFEPSASAQSASSREAVEASPSPSQNTISRPHSRGGNSLKSGKTYEEKIAAQLKTCKFNGKPLQVSETAGASATKHDIDFVADGIVVSLECKNGGAFECGGRCLKVTNGKLIIREECLHQRVLGNYCPFGGKIPAFLRGDKTLKTWANEKQQFRDEYIKNLPTNVMCEYYKSKGVHYIQIADRGLFRTGADILNLGVPTIACEVIVRIRCKQHSSSSMPSSVQASFVFNKKTIPVSPFDLVSNIPENLRNNDNL
ncbi:MAG: hypothetical protein M0R33_15360 [Methylomonas sp.]|jgi:hypothetical protein|uniref:hypothetical protein n=1 Tax=Methylomonas sp. TaxID=418 RepID=UPI0025EDFAE8|nr:hypothetical protein [Methylomonas sp.]MCK9607820.1 hypothetical protein [Methylomonas sp.]